MARNNRGFSLIELMLIVGIIAVLVTVATPKFRTFQAKAKFSEAKVMLSHITTLQESYALENGGKYLSVTDTTAAKAYGFSPANTSTADIQCPGNGIDATTATNAASLGFKISPCDANAPLFAYSINANVAGDKYMVTANSGVGSKSRVVKGAAPQKITVDEARAFTTVCDAIKNTLTDTGCDAVAAAAP